MTEIKTVYNVANLDLREINIVLAQIAARIDTLEGLRGTPRFYSAINAGGNKIQNVTQGTEIKEALTYEFVDTLGQAAYRDVGVTVDTVASGDTGVTNGDLHDHVGGDGAQIDHNQTGNLSTGDVHTHYLLLAGRNGGQIIIGGTESGDDISFQTTSNVTKGSYIFSEMTTAGYLKNDVNGIITGGNAVVISPLDIEIFTDTDTLDANNDVAICNKATAMDMNLPASSGGGKVYYIKNINTGTVTVTPNGADTIDSAATYDLAQWDSVTVIDYDSGTWAIL